MLQLDQSIKLSRSWIGEFVDFRAEPLEPACESRVLSQAPAGPGRVLTPEGSCGGHSTSRGRTGDQQYAAGGLGSIAYLPIRAQWLLADFLATTLPRWT